ncbi:MAG: PilT/PilU family type 4a pilus ATPase [Deltaproteobacteria bacterium]|nr:PilT/PilU family type 4a pilus ATPase [Deltaproteobacteria bacterium]
MTGSELVRQLRATPPRGPDEAVALAAGVGTIGSDHALRLLDHLVKGGLDAVQVHAQGALFVHVVQASADRGLFAPLVKSLKSNDPALRAVLAQALPKVNDPAAHAELAELLHHADPGVRASAGQVLAAVGGRTVLALIDDFVKEPSFPGRGVAIDVAVRIAGHHAIPTLVEAFPRANQQEKLKILKYLGEERFMGRDRVGALRALAIGLVDDNEMVVSAAVSAFSTLASEPEWFAHVAPMLDSPSLSIVRAALEGLRRFASVQAVAALERKLHSGPQSVRLVVLDVLESLDTDAILPLLVEALGHRQIAVRARAAEVLAHVGASGKIDVARTVMWLLHSKDAEVRRYAVEVARHVPDPANTLWPRLVAHLRDEDWWVRERVADALVDLAGQKLVRYVVPLLETGSAPVRMFAVGVIRRLRAAAAIGALVRTAQVDPDWWVRECAIEAIGTLKDVRAAPHVAEIALKEPEFRLVALAALSEMGARDMAPHVARVLGDESAEVRLAALDCLEKLGDAAQAGTVQRLLGDSHVAVAERARKLLQRWSVAATARPLAELEGSPLDRLLLAMAGAGGDDLLLVPGRPPFMKRLGRVEPIGEHVLAADDVRDLVLPLLSAQQTDDLEARRDVDLSYRVEGEGSRFRANIFRQIHGVSAVFRVVRGSIPSLDELGLPPVVRGLGDLPNGLVLVGGPTGSGKSTTLAALIDRINRTSSRHVISFEDPIEVVHPRARGLVNQRELGTHTGSFAAALRATLRQDPDVILVGEMRDLATISFAVSVAETGHLVLGTVHTVSADTTLDRLINTFPAGSQDQVRAMLAGSLRAVVCQYLLPRADGKGRVLATEVMLNNDAVANMIRKGKCYQLPSVIATSRDQGMQSMDAELMRFYNAGEITADTAYAKARDKKQFEALAPPDPKKAGA